MTVLGVALIGVGILFLLMGWGGMAERMPTQVPSRGAAAVPLVVGVALVIADLVG